MHILTSFYKPCIFYFNILYVKVTMTPLTYEHGEEEARRVHQFARYFSVRCAYMDIAIIVHFVVILKYCSGTNVKRILVRLIIRPGLAGTVPDFNFGSRIF